MYIGMLSSSINLPHRVLWLFVCFSNCDYLISHCCFSTLWKSDKRGWLTRWLPWSFTNPMWHSDTLCLNWIGIFPLSIPVFPILFWCIPPFVHFGTFHSSPITQIQQGGWKCSNVIFPMTQNPRIANLTIKWKFLPWTHEITPWGGIPLRLGTTGLFIYSNIPSQLVSLLRDGSVLFLFISWDIWNKQSVNQPIKSVPLTIIRDYAPTLSSPEETKDAFYDSQATAFMTTSTTEQWTSTVYVQRDFNARVRNDSCQISWENTASKNYMQTDNKCWKYAVIISCTQWTTTTLSEVFWTKSVGASQELSSGISLIWYWQEKLTLDYSSVRV